MKRTVAATAFLLAIALASCDGEPADVIDRATFVETIVDLRWEAVHAPDFRLPAGAREEILARHGVEAEDLRRFAEVHGTDLEFMSDVWNEVEVRLKDRQADES